MFKGFTNQALDFMSGIRDHNDKEWFEEHKQIYLDNVYYPMKELCTDVSEPFTNKYGMMSKAGRIYSDPSYPPYRKYREDMWFIIKYETFDWSKTPSLFFELSGDGAVYGFKLTHPAAPVMEKFRNRLATDGGELIKDLKHLERSGFDLSGDEYKRPKPCEDKAALRYYSYKSLRLTASLPSGSPELFGSSLSDTLKKAFRRLVPLVRMFEEFVSESEAEKRAQKEAAAEQSLPSMPEAPQQDFMW